MASQSIQRDPHISSVHKSSNPTIKHPTFGHLPLATSGPQDCALRGTALLATPYFNKGAGFTPEEREEFNLTGLLPQNVQTLDQQVKRAYEQYKTRSDPLAKNTFMASLGIQNHVLFYRVSAPETDLEVPSTESGSTLSQSWELRTSVIYILMLTLFSCAKITSRRYSP